MKKILKITFILLFILTCFVIKSRAASTDYLSNLRSPYSLIQIQEQLDQNSPLSFQEDTIQKSIHLADEYKTDNNFKTQEKFTTENINSMNAKIALEPLKIYSPIEKMYFVKNIKTNLISYVSTLDEYQEVKVDPQDLNKLKNIEETEQVSQFGYNIFKKNINLSFTNVNLPIGPGYILGPGDSLIIYMWGKIEKKLEVTIGKDGTIYLPELGNISLGQLTFSEAKNIIKQELGKKYVNFDLSITMGNLRTIKVFVLGDIENPGAYNLSSVATMFQALYAAGGPKKTGSLREIYLIRNKKRIESIDLYKYLLKGDNSQDPNLKENDTVFVPAIKSVAKINGMVNRPAIYELQKGTSIYDLIELSGGLIPNSYFKKIQVERIENNTKKIVLDLTFQSIEKFKTTLELTPAQNGDAVSILAINNELNNYVTIEGNIERPGNYELKKDMSLNDLITLAEGFSPNTYQERIEIYRYKSKDSRELNVVDFNNSEGKKFKLIEKDFIKVYSSDEIKGKQYVYVDGAVKNKGTYTLYKNMKIADLIFTAQLDPFCELTNAELFRKMPGETPFIATINLKNILANPNSLDNMILEEDDRLFIRFQEDKELKKIKIEGEVKYPGTYVFRNGEKLSSVIERAGDFSEKAFLPGAIFIRKSVIQQATEGQDKILDQERKRLIYDRRLLPTYKEVIEFLTNKIKENSGRLIINLENLDKFKNTNDDVILENDDYLKVPQKPSAVQIIGGVQHPNVMVHVPNKDAFYYIDQAGGYTEFADTGEMHVIKANGTITKQLWNVEIGDSIYIPEKVKRDIDWFDALTKVTTIIYNFVMIKQYIGKL